MGAYSPLDALLVINELNDPRYHDADTKDFQADRKDDANFFDTNGDDLLSPLDALQVINWLNRGNEAPTLTAQLLLDSGLDESSNSDGITFDPTVVGNVFVSREMELIYRIDGAESINVVPDNAGDFVVSPSLALDGSDDGDHSIEIEAKTRHGQTTTTTVEFTLDTVGPEDVSFSLNAASRMLPSNPHLTTLDEVGIVGETLPNMEIWLSPSGRKVISDNDGQFSFDGLSASANTNPYTITAQDTAGNRSEFTLMIDRVFNDSSELRLDEDGWLTEEFVRLELSPDSENRFVSFDIDAVFDTSDEFSLVGDLFNVYLFDSDGPDRSTILDRGRGGESLLSLSEDGADFSPEFVTFDGTSVTIELSSLSDRSESFMVLQLINGDNDNGTTVGVSNVLNDIAIDETDSFTAIERDIEAAGGAVDLTGYAATAPNRFDVKVENVRVDSESGDYVAEIMLYNTGEPASRNIALLIEDLPQGVSVLNASGFDASGNAYLNIQDAVGIGGLDHGAMTVPVEVRISNPQLIKFDLATSILSTGDNQPPALDPIADITVSPGGVVSVDLVATDIDDDRIQFAVTNAQNLPSNRLIGTTLTFAPKPEDVGTHSVIVQAGDGIGNSRQEFVLNVVGDNTGTTRISGSVLDSDGISPLPNVPVSLGEVETTTDSSGNFMLDASAISFGDVLKIHGNDANIDGKTYPFVAEHLELLLENALYDGFNNVIARPIYLPPLDVAGGTEIVPGATTKVRQEISPGEIAEVVVAPGSLLSTDGVPFEGVLSITEVPRDFTPAALPGNLWPDTVVTIQPGEMVFNQPAPLTLFNRAGYAPGTTMDLWSINPETGRFDIVGQGEVSANGLSVETVEGGIRNSSWHFFTPDWDGTIRDLSQIQVCGDEALRTATSMIELHSGAIRETHDLVTYHALGATNGFTLNYNSQRADPRPIIYFGLENVEVTGNVLQRLAAVARVSFSRGNFFREIEGYGFSYGSQPFEHFWSLPPEVASTSRITTAVQGDISDQPTGIYDATVETAILVTAGIFEGEFVGGGGVSATVPVVHVNSTDSAFGAGWELGGIQYIVENPDESLLLVDGSSEELVYVSQGGDGVPFQNPPGDFSTVLKNAGGYERTTKHQTVYQFDTSGLLSSVTDRNGNQTQYMYDSGKLTRIIDPVGLETSFQYNGEFVDSIVDPAGKVTKLTYENGNLVGIENPDGGRRTFGYDSRNHLFSEIDQNGNRETTVYGPHGRAQSSTRKDGSKLDYAPVQTSVLQRIVSQFDADTGFPTAGAQVEGTATVIDSKGDYVRTTVDQAGQYVSSVDNHGPRTSLSRNSQNLVTVSNDGRGSYSSYSYDEMGNVITVREVFSGDGFIAFEGQNTTPPPQVTMNQIGFDSAVALDANNDGYDDVVTTFGAISGNDLNGLGVFLSDSAGAFESRFIELDFTPSGVTAGRFNDDEFIDLAVVSENSFVKLLMGMGNAEFEPVPTSNTFSFTSSIAQIVSGDFNGDRVDDLFVVGQSTSSGFGNALFQGKGDGSFFPARQFGPAIALGQGETFDVATADIDGDGISDIVLSTTLDSGSVGIYYGGADLPLSRFVVVDGLGGSIDVGDFDGNGRVDIVGTSNGLAILLQSPAGTFSLSDANRDRTIFTSEVVAVDLNNDSFLDILSWGERNNRTILGVGNGEFLAPVTVPTTEVFTSAVGDFNADGVLDVFVATDQGVAARLGSADGRVINGVRLDAGVSSNISTGDFNSDGILDVVGATGDGYVTVVPGNGFANTSVDIGNALDPRSVAVGDFDNDGLYDIATAEAGSDRLTIFFGTEPFNGIRGDFTRSGASLIDVGSSPVHVISVDIDTDGFADLVSANRGDNTVSVAMNNGDGSFSSPDSYSTGLSPIGVVSGDIDGDGDIDLIVANSGSLETTVLYGNGTGTFDDGTTVAMSGYAVSISMGRFDDDQEDDFAILLEEGPIKGSSDNLALIYGGSGLSLVDIPLSAPVAMTVGQLNGDNRDDLAVSHWIDGQSKISVLLSGADRTLRATSTIDSPIAAGPFAMAVGDVDREGGYDLVIAHEVTGPREINLNVYNGADDGTFDGDDTFNTAPSLPLNFFGAEFTSLTSGDFDSDGFIELVGTDTLRAPSYRLQTIDGNDDGLVLFDFFAAAIDFNNDVATGDFNGDGAEDVVAFNYGGNNHINHSLSIVLGNGDLTFQSPILIEDKYRDGINIEGIVDVVDFDGDGLADIVLDIGFNFLDQTNAFGVVFANQEGEYEGFELFPLDGITRSSVSSLKPGDLDNDGDMDIAVVRNRRTTAGGSLGTIPNSSELLVFYQGEDGSFGDSISLSVGPLPNGEVTTADLDGNGFLDVVYATDSEVSVFYGKPEMTYEVNQVFDHGMEVSHSVSATDINSDGFPDLVVGGYFVGATEFANPSGRMATIFVNTGNGAFLPPESIQLGGTSIALGDATGDGKPDLISRMQGGIQIFSGRGQSGGSNVAETRYTYDETFNLATSITDAVGRKTRFALDDRGNRIAVHEPLYSTYYTPLDNGLVGSILDPRENRTNFQYDNFGRLRRAQYVDQSSSTSLYDESGNRISATDEEGNTTWFRYDQMNRLTYVDQPEGVFSLYDYDQRGNLVYQEDSSGSSVTYAYDKMDRIDWQRNNGGEFMVYSYTDDGNLSHVRDGNDNTTRHFYDRRDRKFKTIVPNGDTTFFSYDDDDNLIEVKDSNDNATAFEYDARNRVVLERDALGRETVYVYDEVNNLTELRDRNGRITEFVYDDADRLEEAIWYDIDEVGINAFVYTYDDNDNLLSVTDNLTSVVYTYDSRNRVKTQSNGETFINDGLPNVTLSYRYDATGNVLSVSELVGGSPNATTRYAYDGVHRATTISQSGGSASNKFVDLVYNKIGQFDEVRRFTDLEREDLVAVSDYDYDDLNRLKLLRHGTSEAPDAFSFFGFDYDAGGRIEALTDVNGRSDFGYDASNQLQTVERSDEDERGDEFYSYDEVGNRESSHLHTDDYETEAGNRLSTDGVYTYEYDGEGNLRLRKNDATGEVREFTFDHRNRLTRVTDYVAFGGAVQQTVDFVYDGLDRRIAKTVRGAFGETSEHFIYNGEHVLLDFIDADGSADFNSPVLRTRYLFGPGADNIVAQEVTGTTQWMLTDHLGTVHDIISDSGVTVSHFQFDSFGNLLTESLDVPTRYLFTGREFEQELDIYYYRARFYDARIGRFLSEDPIGFDAADANLFRYVFNSPIMSKDPTGLESFLACRSLAGGLAVFGDHCFVVTNSTGPGNGVVHSFGRTNDGSLGRVDVNTEGFSETTYNTDAKAWNSANTSRSTKIPASDSDVRLAIYQFLETAVYDPTGFFSANSNSAARAIADRAAGKTIPLPGRRWKFGESSFDELVFGIGSCRKDDFLQIE